MTHEHKMTQPRQNNGEIVLSPALDLTLGQLVEKSQQQIVKRVDTPLDTKFEAVGLPFMYAPNICSLTPLVEQYEIVWKLMQTQASGARVYSTLKSINDAVDTGLLKCEEAHQFSVTESEIEKALDDYMDVIGFPDKEFLDVGDAVRVRRNLQEWGCDRCFKKRNVVFPSGSFGLLSSISGGGSVCKIKFGSYDESNEGLNFKDWKKKYSSNCIRSGCKRDYNTAANFVDGREKVAGYYVKELDYVALSPSGQRAIRIEMRRLKENLGIAKKIPPPTMRK